MGAAAAAAPASRRAPLPVPAPGPAAHAAARPPRRRHWTEKDALPWARERLQGALAGAAGCWRRCQLPLSTAAVAAATCLATLLPTCHPATSPRAPFRSPRAPPAELLGSAELTPGGGAGGASARATGLKRCEGEAVVNNRKQKVIAIYELAVTFGWAGAAADGTPVEGAPRAGRGRGGRVRGPGERWAIRLPCRHDTPAVGCNVPHCRRAAAALHQ